MARGKYSARGRDDSEDGSFDDLEEGEDWGDDAVEVAPRRSLFGDLKDRFTNPPAPKEQRPPRSTAAIVNGLDRREWMIGVAAVLVAIALTIYLGIAYAHQAKNAKPKVDWLIVVAIVGVPTLLMAIGVGIKRRALLGFTSLLAGYAMLATGGGLFGLLFFAFGIWLVVRAYRYNKQAREAAGTSGAGRSRTAGTKRASGSAASSGTSSGRAAKSPAPDSGKSGSGGKGSGSSKNARESVAAPAKSKRYTPPRDASPQRRRTPSS